MSNNMTDQQQTELTSSSWEHNCPRGRTAPSPFHEVSPSDWAY